MANYPLFTEMRWSIISLFAFGWLMTVGHFQHFPLEYTLFNAISLVSCGLLLLFLDGPLAPVLPIWLGLEIFLVNHFLKFYLITVDPELLNTPPMLGLVGTVPPTEDTLLATYAAIACGFAAFCLVSTGFAIAARNAAPSTNSGRDGFAARGPQYGIAAAAMLAVAVVVAKALTLSLFNFTRGRELLLVDTLPSHSIAILENFMPSVISLISLVLIDQGLRTNRRVAVLAGLAMLLVDAGADLVFTSSKSSLGRAAILLGFFWLATGRKVRFKQILFFAACGLVSAILYPFVVAFRYMRGLASTMPMSSAMKLAASVGSDPNFHFGVVRMIFMRLTGADMVLALIDHHVERISWWTLWASGTYADQYASLEIFGAPIGEGHKPIYVAMLTPVGLFYLYAGNIGAIVGMAAFTAIILAAWRWLWSRSFVALPAFCAFFMMTLFSRLMEGDLGYQTARALPLYLMAGVLVECTLTGPGRMIAAAMSRRRRRPEPLLQGEAGLTPA